MSGFWSSLLWLEISVNYAQVVQMVEGQGQLCKVEFHIFFCKHNLLRTGQIYSLNSEKKFSSKKKKQQQQKVFSIELQLPQREKTDYCHNINIADRLQDADFKYCMLFKL